MRPFDAYPGCGLQLLGRPRGGDNCRHGYGLDLQRRTGQTGCAYCGLDLVADYHRWLLLSVDHVVPRGQASLLGIPSEYAEDIINLVLCCAGCNGFGNRYRVVGAPRPSWSLTDFVALRDDVFDERSRTITERRRAEEAFFRSQPWKTRP